MSTEPPLLDDLTDGEREVVDAGSADAVRLMGVHIGGELRLTDAELTNEHGSALPASGSAPGTPCSGVELVGLGIDRGMPLGVTGLRARCDLDTATRRGQGSTVAIWLIQAAVRALATLAIASCTGLIRKPS